MTKRMNLPRFLFQHKIAAYEDILAANQLLPDDLHLYECVIRDFCSVGLLFKPLFIEQMKLVKKFEMH
jgi:hypothetical protein